MVSIERGSGVCPCGERSSGFIAGGGHDARRCGSVIFDKGRQFFFPIYSCSWPPTRQSILLAAPSAGKLMNQRGEDLGGWWTRYA